VAARRLGGSAARRLGGSAARRLGGSAARRLGGSAEVCSKAGTGAIDWPSTARAAEPRATHNQEIPVERRAEARWSGDLKGGRGSIKLGSGAFEGSYSFGTRFENASGTNPEELLGAAHAGCFSMALALALSTAGHVPKSIATTAKVRLEQSGTGFAITGIDLITRGEVPGVSAGDFRRMAEETKTGCIVSRALSAVPMTLDAQLVS
jgi:osmotically inducible protein OsmC